MSSSKTNPESGWHRMRSLNQFVVRKYGPKFRGYRLILLLTTKGRKSGLPRTTPLQYEEEQGLYYIGSARGIHADWVRNIMVHPEVDVQVKERRFRARAEVVIDKSRVIDFLRLRLKRHPVMVGLIMRLDGLPVRYTQLDFEEYAADKAFAVLHPLEESFK
jgi:deazaflavin-dependent oxidoreductase (nitroreductase family)